MWARILAFPLLCTVVACGSSRSEEVAETPRAVVDTVITSRTVVDTMLITVDTSIALDTTIRVDTTVTVDTTRIEAGTGEIVDTTQ